MEYIDKFKQFYSWADSISDPRTAEWPLVKTPYVTYVASLVYILFSTKIGPYFMEKREPFKLKWLLVAYNIALTYLNYHIFKELIVGMLDAGYSWPCEPYVISFNHPDMRIAAALWWYYVSKIIEFIDTIFFVLRKKNNQISFLHVYHHSTMPVIWWMGIKWTPSGQSAHAALVNAFIHIIMYFYYGMAALGPEYQKYLWWKRYLTQMQLIQFTFALCVAVYALYIDCDFPRWMSWALICYMISFLILFGNFYLQAYIKKRRSKSDDKTVTSRHTESERKTQNGTTRRRRLEK